MADVNRRELLRALPPSLTPLAGCAKVPGTGRTPTDARETTERPGRDGAWPEFQLDRWNTGYAADASGVGPDPTVDWTFEAGGQIWSSPVVSEGLVYIGSGDGNLYAIDAATGDEAWRYETDRRVEGTAAVARDTVYFGSFDRHVYALDAQTGEERWTHDTGAIVRSSPTIVDGAVYVGAGCHNLICEAYAEGESRGWIYSLDADTGERRWRHETGAEVVSSPAVASGSVYVGSSDAHLYALDVSNGEVRWRHEIGDWVWSSPSVVDGDVYFAGWDATVYAVDSATGEERWSDWVEEEDYVSGSTAVDDDTVYIGTTPDRGIEPTPSGEERRGTVYGFDRETGDRRWTFQTDAPEIGSSPAVSEDRLYIGAHAQAGNAEGTGVYALTTDGEREWFFEVDGRGVGSSPALVDDALYFGAANGRVYALG